MKGRSPEEIFYDILRLLKLNPPQYNAQIITKCHLASPSYITYIDLMFKMGLVQKIVDHRIKKNYRKVKWEITNKGLKYMGLYEDMKELTANDKLRKELGLVYIEN